MNNPIQLLIIDIRERLLLYGSVSMGIFLFILFFQPFPGRFTDLNSILVFNAGYGAILFLLLYLVHFASRIFRYHDSETLSYVNGFVLLVLSSVAFTFYLRYVGQAHITFSTVVKMVLLCLSVPVILGIYRVIRLLKEDNVLLVKENASLQHQRNALAGNSMPETVEFHSVDASEVLRLSLTEIVMVKSADNYVEIYFKNNGTIRTRLIRNTLKNIEDHLLPYTRFVRCHRTCIINMAYVEKFQFKLNDSCLTLKDFAERIPVSRQYIVKLKDSMAAQKG